MLCNEGTKVHTWVVYLLSYPTYTFAYNRRTRPPTWALMVSSRILVWDFSRRFNTEYRPKHEPRAMLRLIAIKELTRLVKHLDLWVPPLWKDVSHIGYGSLRTPSRPYDQPDQKLSKNLNFRSELLIFAVFLSHSSRPQHLSIKSTVPLLL